jgi:hypothetical protein
MDAGSKLPPGVWTDEETLLGASLEVVLRRLQLDWRVCLRIASRVAGALAQLHATQRIYRQVRSGLILVADDLAEAALVPHRPDAPATGNEWAYLSPEQTGRMN